MSSTAAVLNWSFTIFATEEWLFSGSRVLNRVSFSNRKPFRRVWRFVMSGLHFVVPMIFFSQKSNSMMLFWKITWFCVQNETNRGDKNKVFCLIQRVKWALLFLSQPWSGLEGPVFNLEISQSSSYVSHGILNLVILKMVWIKLWYWKLWTNRHHPNTAVSLCNLLGLRLLPVEVLEVDSWNWFLRLHYPYLAQASSRFLVYLIIHEVTFLHHYDSTIIPFCVRIEYSLSMTQKRSLMPKALVEQLYPNLIQWKPNKDP